MHRAARRLVGDGDQDVLGGEGERAGRPWDGVAERLPGGLVEAELGIGHQGLTQRARPGQDAAGHAPGRVDLDANRHATLFGRG